MMQSHDIPAETWVLIGTGPHSLFWAKGGLRIAMGDAAPANPHDSLYMVANGQVKSFTYNGTEGVWVRPVADPATVKAVQISASELFLVDAEGNLIVDGVQP